VFEPGRSELGQWLTAHGGYTGLCRSKEPAEPEHVITPATTYEELADVLPPGGYVCSYPRKEGYNALVEEWAAVNYCNPNFSKRRNPEKIGPTDFARRAIEEQAKGNTTVLTLPVFSYIDMLMRAGAELRPLGRVPWLHVKNRRTASVAAVYGCLHLARSHARR
jgi:hypothetical protein